MMAEFESGELLERMRAARMAAEAHMGTFESEGEAWEEPALTDLLLATAHPVARFVKFNQMEEGKWTGADWIWWWLDHTSGEAYGAVIQAKRLKRKSSKWWIDFRYNEGQQRENLYFTAHLFDLVPLYVLYLGTIGFRGGAFCREQDHLVTCERCRMSTLSVVPALVTSFGGSEYDATSIALSHHISLEELADPEAGPRAPWSPDFPSATDDFLRFLSEPQVGSRQIARKVVDQIRLARAGMFSAATRETASVRSEAIFPEVPDDRGHFAVPYFPHALRGLRTVPPDYVKQFVENGTVPDGMDQHVGGLAVFSI